MMAAVALGSLVLGTAFGMLVSIAAMRMERELIEKEAVLRGRNIERRARGEDELVNAPQIHQHHHPLITPGGPIP